MIPAATILAEGTCHPSPLQGATQTGVEEVTKRFKKYSPFVYSSHFQGASALETVNNVRQCRINSGILDRILGNSYLKKVAASIKEAGIKIVHVRNRPLNMPILRKLLGDKAILILHEHNQNIADTLTSAQAISVLDAIDAYVAVSRFTYDFEITNKYSQYKNKASVILNGVNLDKFRPLWEQKEKARSLRGKYGVENSINILFSGAIRERKGIHLLVDAFKLVIKKYPDAKLIIAGGSKDNLEANDAFARKVRASVEEISKNVIFTGYIPPTEIQDVYLLGDIFVGPSIWDEAFGLVFAEASACGLAVIGSRRGGIPEIIDDGRTGLFINDPENINEIADKINMMIGSAQKRDEFGHAARKRMEDKFSWDRTAKEIENLYDKLLSK